MLELLLGININLGSVQLPKDAMIPRHSLGFGG